MQSFFKYSIHTEADRLIVKLFYLSIVHIEPISYDHDMESKGHMHVANLASYIAYGYSK